MIKTCFVKNLIVRGIGSAQNLCLGTTLHQILIGVVSEIAITLIVNQLLLLAWELT